MLRHLLSTQRENTYSSPQSKAKTDSGNRSFTRATSQASTTAKKSLPSNRKTSVSPFFRQDLSPNRQRSPPPRSSSPVPMSQTVKERFFEIEKNKQQARETGKEAHVKSVRRKEMLDQVKILENRIKKLQQEEEVMMRKIQDTTQKTEKFTDVKKRRTDDLVTKAKRNQKQNEELNRKRQELQQERENQRRMLRQSVEESLRAKLEIANNVKMENKLNKMIKEEKFRVQKEKNQELINKIRSFEKSVIHSKVAREHDTKADLSQYYTEKINNDKEEAEMLEKKLRELAKLEEGMISRLNQTYSLHKSKFEELENVFNMRVTTPILQTEEEEALAKSEIVRQKPTKSEQEPQDTGEKPSNKQNEKVAGANSAIQNSEATQAKDEKKESVVKQVEENGQTQGTKPSSKEKVAEAEKKQGEEAEELPDLNDPGVQKSTLMMQKAFFKKKLSQAKESKKESIAEQVVESGQGQEVKADSEDKDVVNEKKQDEKKQEEESEELPDLNDPGVQKSTLMIQKAFLKKKMNKAKEGEGKKEELEKTN